MAARPLVSGAGRLTNGHTNGHTRKIGNMTSLRKQHFFSQNSALFWTLIYPTAFATNQPKYVEK